VTEPARIGKYEVLEKIAEGGFAAVYKGRDPFLKRLVALKVCLSDDEHLRRRFLREAEIAGTLHHRNVVTAFDFGFAQAGPYLVQEYLDGEDLKEKIRRRDPLSPGRKLGYLRQIALGLEYAHSRGVLHRDIKPGNVRVLDNDRVKILDFGIARLASADTRLTEQGSILGTAGYLPPEQLLGHDLDARADVFSFGALAYELLTYRRPFVAPSLSELFKQVLAGEPPPIAESWPDCPPELAALIARCLAKDPAQRVGGFGEVVAELTPILARTRAIERANGALPAAAPAPPAEGEAGEAGDDAAVEETRPIPVAEVAAAVAATVVAEPAVPAPSAGEPEELEPPGLRARQEVESTMMSLARTPAGGARPTVRARLTALGGGLRAAAAPALAVLRRRVGGLGARAGGVWLRRAALVLVAFAAVGAIGWLVVRRAQGPAAVAAPEPEPPLEVAATGPPAGTPASGTLVVEASPWGEVSRIADASGTEVTLPNDRSTPLVVLVPPGVYDVELTRPDAPAVQTCRVEVRPGASARCRVQLVTVAADDYFREAGWWR
jgi:tRNA A-37 threonylcarbamoyl transferase component Bud32